MLFEYIHDTEITPLFLGLFLLKGVKMIGYTTALAEYERRLSEPPRDYEQERREKEDYETDIGEMSYEESRLFAFEMDMLQAESYTGGY